MQLLVSGIKNNFSYFLLTSKGKRIGIIFVTAYKVDIAEE